ncbi:hypothetical protein [Aurantibacillus circumpalustris]|uniref:hypothetical protein n=1 Tax=Aurantibacillus circumpalustris TaxID=3036359 RepID=UPI00295B3332|nr:hypothetical protein [Aurantibacillus circumpalustris]
MKPSKIKIGLLAIVILPFLTACPKPRENMAPPADTELQSSIDAAFATFVVTDIDMICSFSGEGDTSPDFYLLQSSEDPGKMEEPVFDVTNDQISTTYYNDARCIDGRVRNGTVMLFFSNTNPNAKYYRAYEYVGRIRLVDFKVDGWLIENLDGNDCHVYNRLSSPSYDPSKTNISWLIDGAFKFTHTTDPSKNMVWKGKLTKTLTNTNDPTVFNPSKQNAINWSKAVVSYAGEATGYTSSNVPFKMEINAINPILRDFSCYPDAVGGIENVSPLKIWKEEFHPFKAGIATLTTSDRYPRQIYFGNEGNTDLTSQCDNSGVVLIKGNSYPVDFKK